VAAGLGVVEDPMHARKQWEITGEIMGHGEMRRRRDAATAYLFPPQTDDLGV
jgi:hypothetical protein